MSKKELLTYVCVGLIVLAIFPLDLSAASSSDFGADAISSEGDRMMKFLFGAPMKVAGILGGAYGLVQAILTSNVKPLLTFGGIGLAVNIAPKFIEGVFNARGILLP